VFGFKLALWLTTGQCTKEWVAVHRKHHAFTDEEGDPHSPAIEGFWKVQLGNVYYYIREAKKTDVLERYARDIEEGWWDRQVFKRGLLGLFLGTMSLCVVFAAFLGLAGVWWALLAAGTHAVMYVFVLSSSINGLCHRVGYKNFDNTATNIRLIALLTGGEGLHNNHTVTGGARSSAGATAVRRNRSRLAGHQASSPCVSPSIRRSKTSPRSGYVCYAAPRPAGGAGAAAEAPRQRAGCPAPLPNLLAPGSFRISVAKARQSSTRSIAPPCISNQTSASRKMPR
jgi:hypothetical protein